MAALAAVALLSCCLAGAAPEARVEYGTLVGAPAGAVDAYLGIPFARPPTGSRRFAAPEDWAERYPGGRLDATAFGPRCPQAGGGAADGAAQDEDCLFLNVWVPRGAAAGMPALVFLYGGSFTSGAGDDYDGAELAAATGATVVNLNYRLGALGFALIDALPGNLGVLDQQSALRWLARQGGAFGIDVGRTLLFGESAGAQSVALHMVLPGSAGLFSSALMESGVAACVPERYARRCGRRLAELLGCPGPSSVGCLRGRPWRDVLAAQTSMLTPPANGTEFDVECSFWIAVDGHTVPQDPEALMLSGSFHPVPAVVGVNRNEGNVIAYSEWPGPVAPAEFRRAVAQLMGSRGSAATPQDVSDVLAAYPARSADDLRSVWGQLLGDYLFICRSRRFLRLHQRARGAPAAFEFVFAQRAQRDPAPEDWGVYHSSELPFVFGPNESGSISRVPALTPGEEALRRLIGRLWRNLAHHRDPNDAAPDGPAWPRYDAGGDAHLELRAGGAQAKFGFHRKECDAWDAVWDRHAAGAATLVV